MNAPLAARIRAAHDQHVAAIPDTELQAGDDITLNPQPSDWADIRGRYDPTCTNFDHNDMHALWADWLDNDEGAL